MVGNAPDTLIFPDRAYGTKVNDFPSPEASQVGHDTIADINTGFSVLGHYYQLVAQVFRILEKAERGGCIQPLHCNVC